jgi:hypothetical protein
MAGIDRLSRLSLYLHKAARVPFVWGEFDCLCGFVSGWVDQERGGDSAGAFRGSYDDEEGAARVMEACGGMGALIGACAGEAGCTPTTEPAAGDIGMVKVGGLTAGAIRTGKGWAVLRIGGGYSVSRLRHVSAWAV